MCCTRHHVDTPASLHPQGKITAFYPSNGKFQIKYDDRQVESLHIEKERVQWYMPRGRSAGFRPELHSLRFAMGVEGLLPECAEPPAQVPQVRC